MLTFNLDSPVDKQGQLAQKFRALRVFRNLRRKTLAEMSHVPEASIKRFESKGEISFRSLLCLAHALGVLDQFDHIFTLPSASSLSEIEEREKRLTGFKKKRGRK